MKSLEIWVRPVWCFSMRNLWIAYALLAAMPLFASDPIVTLVGGTNVTLDARALATLKRETITASSHGKSSSYEGYALIAVLKAVGADPVESLRGKHVATLVSVSAADGYKVVFALAELDPSLGNKQVLLVDPENGKALPASDGPWRLVVPTDKRAARWARQVIGIELSTP